MSGSIISTLRTLIFSPDKYRDLHFKDQGFFGNDLSTPMTEFGFFGLQEGDRWCLCLARWKQAYDVGKAPHIYLASTHEASFELVPLEVLLDFAVDVN